MPGVRKVRPFEPEEVKPPANLWGVLERGAEGHVSGLQGQAGEPLHGQAEGKDRFVRRGLQEVPGVNRMWYQALEAAKVN